MKENTGDSKGNGRGFILSDLLRVTSGKVTLKVVEGVGDPRATWTLKMYDGPNMLEFLRDDSKLVDGPLLLNCDVDHVAGTDDDGVVVFVVFESEERDDA